MRLGGELLPGVGEEVPRVVQSQKEGNTNSEDEAGMVARAESLGIVNIDVMQHVQRSVQLGNLSSIPVSGITSVSSKLP